MLFNLLPNTLQYLLTSWLLSSAPHTPDPGLRFELRHEHALSNTTGIVFSDVRPSPGFRPETFTVNTQSTTVHKPLSHDSFMTARSQGGDILWNEVDIDGPDVQDRETLLLLAKMANNAYTEPGQKDWYGIGPGWNISYPFGWEPDADGFRGHIFATPDNSTIIIAVKGTSLMWPVGGGGPTQRKDKLNDNLLFSCCCARVGPTWSTVCDCYEGGYKCDQGCLERSLAEDSLFYSIGVNLYNNVTYMYPNSNIWLIGHSLGGALASLVGVTFGVPVVAFEAPAERLAATRLHLPSPPSTHHVTHIYNTGDPIPMGTCTGVSSTCALAGIALETKCHLGRVIRYDTVTKLGWSANIIHHGIQAVIEGILSRDDVDWSEDGKNSSVPAFTSEEDCVDCFNWEFGDYRNVSKANCH
ncbi:alpha/beta-hydrolase [Trametes coccinea BRFM310]|uniref:triacylglycerol lipase n=1 Tax=Trametes coccinea (strain BRFM310) TaxID=1353009 RepID=A0A1Y2ILY4_TRAC3|nr:alpha/beta-hydrolase [Trametes coccinea BRFM310]